MATIVTTPFLVVFVASLVLVVWAVADVSRRPKSVLSGGAKGVWIAAMVIGWLFLGFVGGVVALVYLIGPRRRMNSNQW